MEATRRFLADNMFVRCEAEHPGSEHVEELADKVDAIIQETLHFIRNMGGDAQLHKCAILASSDKLRKKLRGKTWGPERKPIPIAVDIRDLGSHFSCGKRPTSKTLKDRVKAALPIAKRIGYMRLTTARRLRMLKSKVFAKTLYGVEATPMPRGEASRLQTTVIDSAGGYRTKTISPALAIYGTDTPGIDVQAEILKRRMRYLVRYLEREVSAKRKVEQILRGIAEYDVEHPKGPVALIIKGPQEAWRKAHRGAGLGGAEGNGPGHYGGTRGGPPEKDPPDEPEGVLEGKRQDPSNPDRSQSNRVVP